MKIEARCQECSGAYLVEPEALGAGLPCPACGGTLTSEAAAGTAPSVAPEQVDRQPAPIETPPVPAMTDTAPVPVAAAAAVAPASAAPAEVVCPRCNLHFKPRAGTQARAREQTDRLTVLVVEDMVYFREIAAEALGDEYEVLAVSTRDEAQAALRRGGIDLMVLDLTLDGGDGGLDLLRELDNKPCPVLIYTAQDESEMYGDSWDELRNLGADDIVLKGMNVGDELVRKVNSLLGRDVDTDE